MDGKAGLLTLFALGATLTLLAACGGGGGPTLIFTHGVASGDVTPGGVVLWTRVDQEGDVRAQVAKDEGFSELVVEGKQRSSADHDFAVKLGVDGLEPATRYYYRFLPPSGDPSPVGTFETAPAPDAAPAVTRSRRSTRRATTHSAAALRPVPTPNVTKQSCQNTSGKRRISESE